MDREYIKEKVKKIFIDLFQKEEGDLQNICCADNFFSSKMGLLPGDVVAFLYTVEREFGFEVPASYILEGSFNTLENVTNMICEILLKKDNKEIFC